MLTTTPLSRAIARLPSIHNKSASGLICGPTKRISRHGESSSAVLRFVSAREHACFQQNRLALALALALAPVLVMVLVLADDEPCNNSSSALSCKRRSFTCCRDENAARARRSTASSRPVSRSSSCSSRRLRNVDTGRSSLSVSARTCSQP